jgi:hypothetical protein
MVRDAYGDAVKDAADETELPAKSFPQTCRHEAADVLDEDYLPADAL